MAELKLVTFNLCCWWTIENCDSIENLKNTFLNRAGGILFRIREEMPDVLCFQEGTDKIIAVLEANLPEYQFYFTQRDVGFEGEGIAVALRRDTISLLSLDSFWLSPTPNVPGTRFAEQSDYPRVCQILMVRRKSDRRLFWVCNNHLDHIGEQARVLGMRQVIGTLADKLSAYPLPVFVFGDLNALPDSETLQFARQNDKLPLVDLTADLPGTWHDLQPETTLEKIDYILTDPITARKTYRAKRWTDDHAGVFLSDHYPVEVDIDF